MDKQVNSYRYLSGITKRMIKSWIKMETPRPIPWTPWAKPLAECNVALLSSAGIALNTEQTLRPGNRAPAAGGATYLTGVCPTPPPRRRAAWTFPLLIFFPDASQSRF